MKRKYKFRTPVSNRPILGAALEVSDFLRNICLKMRVRFHPVHICRLLSPISKQDFFFFCLTDVPRTPFLFTFFFHSLDYGFFLQVMSGCVFWIEFRDWEKNQLCWLVKSLLFSLLVSSPCYRGLEMHYKHMYCMWMNEAGLAVIQQWLCLNAILTLTTSLKCCNRTASCWHHTMT